MHPFDNHPLWIGASGLEVPAAVLEEWKEESDLAYFETLRQPKSLPGSAGTATVNTSSVPNDVTKIFIVLERQGHIPPGAGKPAGQEQEGRARLPAGTGLQGSRPAQAGEDE